jgi:hypothetical protein
MDKTNTIAKLIIAKAIQQEFGKILSIYVNTLQYFKILITNPCQKYICRVLVPMLDIKGILLCGIIAIKDTLTSAEIVIAISLWNMEQFSILTLA